MKHPTSTRWPKRGALVLALLAFAGAAALALHSAARPIAGAAQCLLALAAAVTATAAVTFTDARRAIAVGALLGGMSYYALAARLPADGRHYPPLATTGLLVEWHSRVVREVPNPHASAARGRGPGGGFVAGGGFSSGFPTSPTVPFPYVRDFIAVGECLWTLVFAVFGGWVAGRFAVRRIAEKDAASREVSR